MIYLAKSGKITGPFTAAEFDRLKHSGEIDRFSWFWDARSSDWKPIDPPPSSAPSIEPHLPQAEPGRAPARHQPNTARASRVEVILHDFRSVASARIRHISEIGCEIIVHSSPSHGTPFAERASVMLNLFDPVTEETMDIAASIHGLTHEAEGLVYRVRWSDAPELLASA